ncbi:MAG: hypothetical protein ACI9SE_002746, partial [Neolewinella sp.]
MNIGLRKHARFRICTQRSANTFLFAQSAAAMGCSELARP